jgi:hypothetical protein
MHKMSKNIQHFQLAILLGGESLTKQDKSRRHLTRSSEFMMAMRDVNVFVAGREIGNKK